MRKASYERKIVKKNKKAKEMKSTNTFVNTDNEITNFIKILLIVTAFVVIFTIITNIVVNKKTKPTPTEIQYTNIIVGNILNKDEKTYYVLVKDNDDSKISTYQNYINTYIKKEEHIRFYYVDLSDGFNEQYKQEESNLKVENISDIKFKTTTLLKIEDGKIVNAIDNSDELEKFLKELSA